MAIQILNDFHGDGVFRDQRGTIWVRQSEMVAGMSRAWDEAIQHQWEHRPIGNRSPHNPYRAAKEEQK